VLFTSVSDPHKFNADPDPTIFGDTEPDVDSDPDQKVPVPAQFFLPRFDFSAGKVMFICASNIKVVLQNAIFYHAGSGSVFLVKSGFRRSTSWGSGSETLALPP